MTWTTRQLEHFLIHNVLFGASARKLTGIKDGANTLTATLTFSAPNTLTLTSTTPTWLRKGSYFRVTGGGGTNLNKLLRVASVNGQTITLDTTAPAVSADDFTGPTTLDGRIAAVINNTNIARSNSEGNTIFNVNYAGAIGIPEFECFGNAMADHFHDEPPGARPPFKFTFTVDDWVTSDAGDLYSLDVNHGLGTSLIKVVGYDQDDEEVYFHCVRILDGNNIRIKVTQAGSDCRFSGCGIVLNS